MAESMADACIDE